MNYFNYFSEIEETFIRRRGKTLLLSPLDWTLIESWQKRGIPQHIVIRSIEKIFDDIAQDPKRNPSVKSIAYCSDEVERQFRDWQLSQAGAGGEEIAGGDSRNDEKEEILRHLSASIESLENAMAKAYEALKPAVSFSIKQLREIYEKCEKNSSINPEKIEQELSALETTLDKALLETSEQDIFEEAQAAVEEHLGKYAGKMQQDVYEKTFEQMVIKKLRERMGIPAFSLFYL